MTAPVSLPQGAGVGRGLGQLLLAILLFTLLDVLAKDLVARMPFVQVVWARFAVQLVLVLLFLRAEILPMLRTPVPGLHLARALTQLGAGGFFFASLAHIGLAEATALADINPVLITLGAALFLGERLGPRRIAAVLVSMAGAWMILRPGSDTFSPAAILPLLGAVCYAAGALITRAVGRTEPVARVMLLSSLICTGIVTLALPFYWVPVLVSDLPRLIAIGMLGTAAQILIIRAFSSTEASVLAPFGYVGIVLATLWGWLFFGEWPDGWTLAGMLVIVMAGVYVWHRETSVRRSGARR
jgi:drug/metabolite transporter (DMT)-like permease